MIDGGSGVDTVSYENSSAVVQVNLSSNVNVGGDAEGDSLMNIENVIGSEYDDTITGDGEDNTIEGGLGADTIDGRIGVDTVSYESSSEAVEIDLANNVNVGGDAEGDSLMNIENIVGSAYGDTLVGGDGDNRIEGGEGDDILKGLLGADILEGGEGIDTVNYEDSIEAVVIDLAEGIAEGGDAEGDVIREIENITGSAYDDMLKGDSGDNIIEGGDGDDILEGRMGDDTIDGGLGVDTASYRGSGQEVDINLAEGTAEGGDAEGDRLMGIENIIGSSYDDTLIGDGEDNTIEGGAGADTIDGGAGVDTVSYESSSQRVQIDLTSSTHTGGDARGDTIREIENIIGSAYNDVLRGDDGVNVITGGEGDDIIDGGDGGDIIDGGEGTDTVSYENSSEAVEIDLAGGTYAGGDAQGDTIIGIENIIGSGHADTITGNNQNNEIEGGAGADTIDGGTGIDTASYENSSAAVNINLSNNSHTGGDAEGDSLMNIENIIGSNFNDNITGDDNDNVIYSMDGTDTIEALGGDDTIYCSGTDSVDGGLGFDILAIGENLNIITTTDSNFSNMEKIQFIGDANNSLVLSSSGITALGGFSLNGDTTFIVDGNDGDRVSTTDDWTANGTLNYEGETYNLFEQTGFQLLIGQDIDTSLIL